MLSEEIRQRLAQLHRPYGDHRTLLPVSESSALLVRQPCSDWQTAGCECENASGKHWRIRRPLASLLKDTAPGEPHPFPRAANASDERHAELNVVAQNFPQHTLFLDLETCGFAGSPVFLVGTVWHDDGQLMLDQLFARHYGEERAVLESLWQVAACNRVLVTFNGKSFDWPMVHDRSTRHHLGRDGRGRSRHADDSSRPAAVAASVAPLSLSRRHDRPQLEHCDLLHHARRRWKHVLPNCRLQTLERFICNRYRHQDLSGALVPAAYQEFVRSGRGEHVSAILHHNALDLATLVQLTRRML